MSKNFTEISSVRKLVDFSQGNDFKSEIFQDVDFKNSGNYQHSQTNPHQYFLASSKEKKPVKIEDFAQNNNHNNPNQINSILQEINDSTLFFLPKTSAHYAVTNLQELQEIDEVNRKLLAIDDEVAKENKSPNLNQASQAIEANLDKSIKKNQDFANPQTIVEIFNHKECAESLVRKSRILMK